MQYSQKYTLVSFLDPKEINTEFAMADWPPHITLADVFAINLDINIEEKIAELLSSQSPITLLASDDATLGETKVVLIEQNTELQALHNQLIDLLELNDATFNTPEFTRSGFLPHSTIQKSGRLHKGDAVEINTISLIDMFPDSNWQQRKVLNNFKMSGTRL